MSLALAAGCVWSSDQSVRQPSLVVCTVWGQLFGWFLVGLWWRIFALLSSPTALSWRRWHRRRRVGALLFQSANAKSSPLQVRTESIAVYCCNRFKKPFCTCHSPKSKRWSTEHHRSPNVDRISMQKKCWQIQLNGKNQPNHCSEPTEPLDSPHESTISKRKFCSRRRLSTRTFVWIFAKVRHFFAPRPRAFTKIAIFVLQNVIHFSMSRKYDRLFRCFDPLTREQNEGCELFRRVQRFGNGRCELSAIQEGRKRRKFLARKSAKIPSPLLRYTFLHFYARGTNTLLHWPRAQSM